MQTITRSLAFVLVLICVLDGMPGIAAAQSSEPPPEILREFQHFDEHLARLHYEPAERRRQEEVLARRGSAAKARLLVDRRQFGAALTEAELIVKAHPGQVVPLLETLQNTWDDLVRDETHDNRSRLRALYSTLRARVRRLPRENAARVARPLVWLESALDERDDEPWRGALARFHKTYSDQDELALSQIEGMLDNSLPAKVEARLAFAKARPRTELAARALYNAAFDLSHNSMLIGERPGSDPTDRFLQVAAIAEDLETGGYPPCEWVTKAPALVVEFRVMDRKSHARDNIPRVLDAYVSFAKRHVGGTALRRGSLLYLFTTVIPEIVAVRGDVDREMDALFARLEHEGLSLGDVRLLRAKYVLTPPPNAGLGVKDFTKSVAAVEALGRDAPEYRRYADGTLAGLHLVTGQYAAARERFQQFVVRYPDSPYAWAAVLRIGQTFEAEGNSDQALAAYIQAGERYGSIPAAQVIAWALAGRIHDSRHRFAEALNAYRRAILAWDTGLGEQVHFGAPISWKVEGVPSTVRVSGELRKTAVAERLGGLIAALAHAGGEHLALGRLHLAARRYRHAAAAFQRFLDVHGSGPRRLEVTGLANHALLLAALDLAADYSPTFDESGALRELDALAKSDLDIYVLAARLAKAGIAWRRGLADEAEAAFGSALLEWQRHRAPRLRQRLSPLERDVMDIRTTFFTPLGSPIWGESARQWPTGMARLLVVNPEVQVSVPNTGPVEIEPLYNPPGPYSNVLFLSRDESAVLAQVIRALGRPHLLPPSTTPLPAIDPSRTILALFNRFFPAYETGHFGLSMYARPTLHRISFLDLERTKANIVVTRDGDGSETYRIEKNNGAWTIKQRLSITIQ